MFLRDAEQRDTWIGAQETFLLNEDLGVRTLHNEDLGVGSLHNEDLG